MNAENLTVSQCSVRSQAPRSLAETLASWRKRIAQRSQLAALDEHALRDLGVNDADVWRETRKSPWEA